MKNLIITLIVLGILGISGYRVFYTFAKEPSAKTISAARAIEKYPNAKSWELREAKNICFFATDQCDQSVKIKFTSDDRWPIVYNYFKDYMRLKGWTTNSTVFTNIPDGAIYKNDSMCEAYVTKDSTSTLGSEKPDNGRFILTVTCKS